MEYRREMKEAERRFNHVITDEKKDKGEKYYEDTRRFLQFQQLHF